MRDKCCAHCFPDTLVVRSCRSRTLLLRSLIKEDRTAWLQLHSFKLMLSLLLLLPALVAAAPAPRLHAARTLVSGRSIQENELVSRADASIPPEYLLKAALGSLSGNELLTSVTFATVSCKVRLRN